MPQLNKATPQKDSSPSRLCRDCGADYEPRGIKAMGHYIDFTGGRCPECKEKWQGEQESKRKAEQAAEIMGERKKRRESIGIPPRFLIKDFSNYEHELPFQAKAFKECYRYAEEFPLEKSVGYRSLYMYSEATKEYPGNGTGKTHLSAAIAHRILDRCESLPFPRIHWVNQHELFARLKATMNYTPEEKKYRQTYDDIIHECFHCNLLIVDDVGKERPKDLAFTQSVMLAIINYRYNNNYPMVITANLNPTLLKLHLGTGTDEASFDRFWEMIEGKMLAIAGPSYRRK